MSFSQDIKKEISQNMGGDRHCRIAMLLAIINTCGFVFDYKNHYVLQIMTENPLVADSFRRIVREDFKCDVITQNLNGKTILLTFPNQNVNDRVLLATGLLKKHTVQKIFKKVVTPLVVKSECCKRAYLRGVFLCVGSISDPEKNYHLEFVFSDEEICRDVMELLSFFSLTPKYVLRKEQHIAYFKESEQISDVLAVIGASVGMMKLENNRAYKDLSNTINRIANCEAANADKSVRAAVKQMEDIILIKEKIGLDSLSTNLRETAELRLRYPEVTIKELGEKFSPPVGKSGINHRLRKLSTIADDIRSNSK